MTESCDVVVVDDDPAILELLEDFLSPTYNVHTAMNAMEGINLLSMHHAQVLVTDLYLPIMDGVDFIERVRANPKFEQTAILVLTSYPPLVKRITVPIQGVVIKPFNLDELARAVHQAIASTGPPCA